MIELLNINGTAVSDIDYVEYLGTDFGDSEITNYNTWGKNSIAPRFVPIRRTQFSNASVRFLIKGAPSQVAFEETITSLVTMFRNTMSPTLNYNGFSYVGHCTDFNVKRIVKSKIAEITLNIEGFKCVIETITSPSSGAHTYFEDVLIDSPIEISFTLGGGTGTRNIIVEGEEIVFGSLPWGEHTWSGLTHTLSRNGNPQSSSGMSKLFFPYARVGGTEITVGNGFGNVSIKCYRRLL